MSGIYSYGGFRNSSDAQLLPIRQLELYKTKTKVASDSTLSDEERKRWIEIVVSEAAGQIPVVAATTSGHTLPAVELSRFAQRVGADGQQRRSHGPRGEGLRLANAAPGIVEQVFIGI